MVNKMANLETLISEVSKLKDIQKDTSAGMEASEALKTRSNQVSKLIQLIDQYEQQKQVLKDTSVPVSTPDPASKPLRARCASILESLEGDWIGTLKDPAFNTNFYDPAKAYIETRTTSLKHDWRKYLDGIAPGIDRGLISALPKSGAIAHTAQRLTLLVDQITNAKSDIPETKEDVLELKKSCQAAAQLFNEIDGIPESVRNFLKAASSINGASIEMYNEEIKEWAEENNMTENLRLRFA